MSGEDRTLIRNKESGEEKTPAEGGFIPYLVIVEGPRRGTRFPLDDGDNTFGRSASNSLIFEDQSVSRHHATVTKADQGWRLTDAKSKNGTLLNGKLIQDAVMVGHNDVIQVGIYALRLITHQVSTEEEMAPIPWSAEPGTVMVETPSTGETAQLASDNDGEGTSGGEEALDEESDSVSSIALNEESAPRRWLGLSKSFWLIMAGVVSFGLLAGGWLMMGDDGDAPAKVVTATIKEEKPPQPVLSDMPAEAPVASEGEVAPTETPPNSGDQAGASAPTAVAPPPSFVAPKPPVETIKTVPVFVDFAANPLPARVEFDGRDYGVTPVKINVELTVGKTYTAIGHFVLPELKETVDQPVSITVTENQPLLPVMFRGPIGILKVTELPRMAQLYLEGYVVYDQFHPRNAKLSQVPIGKPIYLPYGRYIVELRQPKSIGSDQFVEDIRYRREIFITEDNPLFTLTVKEEDLTQFPVEIRSVPSDADVLIDAKPVGKTPYYGMFPLGSHQLIVKKEGYFDHTDAISMDINTPYRQEITLKTTVAGERILAGRDLLRSGRHKDAVSKLSEVFENQPSPGEVAQTQYLLGSAFVYLEDLSTAKGYFEQARTHPNYQYPAMLGLSSIYHAESGLQQALPLLVEVLLKATDPAVKEDAKALFKQMSPIKSVFYVYSEPAGAKVTVNGDLAAQPTPVILHDLSVGNYKIRFEKDGYEPKELSLNVSVNEFNPVYVKLVPLK